MRFKQPVTVFHCGQCDHRMHQSKLDPTLWSCANIHCPQRDEEVQRVEPVDVDLDARVSDEPRRA